MIRKQEEKDRKEMIKIWLDANIAAHQFIPKKYWEENSKYVEKQLPKADVYVDEENNEINGFVGINQGYIEGIFVKQNKQSQGIGKALLEKCKSQYPKITLHVYEKNKKAIQFYLRENFKIINQAIDKNTNEVELEMKWIK